MKLEAKYKKVFLDALKLVGAKVIPYPGSKMGVAGTSDTFIAHLKWHGWIEFKGPATPIKPLQRFFVQEMRKRNVPAFIVRMNLEHIFLIEDFLPPTHWNDGHDILRHLIATTAIVNKLEGRI